MNTDSPLEVIVIGAGVSGLLAAAVLQSAGARVLVLDKGRGVGLKISAFARLPPAGSSSSASDSAGHS